MRAVTTACTARGSSREKRLPKHSRSNGPQPALIVIAFNGLLASQAL